MCQADSLAAAHVGQLSVGIRNADYFALLVIDGGLDDGLTVLCIADDGLRRSRQENEDVYNKR